MVFAKISQLAHYAPSQIIKNEDLSLIMDTSDDWISSRTGIKQRHISKNETTADLANKVAEQLIEKSGYSARHTLLVVDRATQTVKAIGL